jgi:hypothetical protein
MMIIQEFLDILELSSQFILTCSVLHWEGLFHQGNGFLLGHEVRVAGSKCSTDRRSRQVTASSCNDHCFLLFR